MSDQEATLFFTEHAMIPQIPRVQDVLHALRYADTPDALGYYSTVGAGNWPLYIANVIHIADVVVLDLLALEPYDHDQARKIVAQAIMDRLPAEAKCLFVSEFVELQEIVVGTKAPSRTSSRSEILKVCGCSSCARNLREELVLHDR